MRTRTVNRSVARRNETRTSSHTKKKDLPVRDRSPTRVPEAPCAGNDLSIARLEANSRYSTMEVLIMIMAYHCEEQADTPENLVKKAYKHIGYTTNTRAVLCTLYKYKYNATYEPEMPFEKISRKWKLNSNAKIGFDDPAWEEFIFARVAEPEQCAPQGSIESESSEASSRTEEELVVSKSLLELGSRPDDLARRVEHLEKEIARLVKIEKKYEALLGDTA